MLDSILKTAEKIKAALKKALTYLRINDEKNRLSLTNIAMIIVLYKLMVTPTLNFEDITALAIGVMGYQIKRAIGKKDEEA